MLSASFILELTKRDFMERYAGSMLGAAWAFIWPLVNLFIYIIIFGQVMGGRLPGTSELYSYSVYVSVGLIPWIAFSGTIGRSANIFLEKKHLITKVRLSLPSLLVFINLTEVATLCITGLFFLGFLIYTDYPYHHRLLLFPVIFYLQQLLAFALGLLSATLTVFVRDLKEVVGIILQLWFWFTPIVYVSSILPEWVKDVMVYNPAFIIIESYHSIFVFNSYPVFKSLLILTVIAHGFLALAYALFRAQEKDLRDCL